jgi:glycine amidinotransferase
VSDPQPLFRVRAAVSIRCGEAGSWTCWSPTKGRDVRLSSDIAWILGKLGVQGSTLPDLLTALGASPDSEHADSVAKTVHHLVELDLVVREDPQGAATQSEPSGPVVNSWNEWDPLEEVIVGVVDDAHIRPYPDPLRTGSSDLLPPHISRSARPMLAELVDLARKQVDELARVLEAEGVVVKRSGPINLGAGSQTPFFSVPCGYNVMNPRDLVLVVGDQLIETPSAARYRYFETFAYRELFKDYFRRGARWSSAPKPTLRDELYTNFTTEQRTALGFRELLTEYEPVFDAADFVRCGKDIFGVRGGLTNRMGMTWLQRHLGDEFRVHEVKTLYGCPLHIDTTFVPLAPGKVLINPLRVASAPDAVKDWDILEAPPGEGHVKEFAGVPNPCSIWIGMNVLMLDQERVFVDAKQTTLIKRFKDWGFRPIPLPFEYPPILGGGFHCVTLDIRRRGTLQSYC